MDEPPAKRVRRTDSTTMWEKNNGMASPRSPKSHADTEDTRRKTSDRENKISSRDKKYDSNRKHRSRSPDVHPKKRDRSRSREKSARDRERDRPKNRERGPDRDRDRAKDDRIRREGGRSRSPQRHRSSRDYPVPKKERSHHRSRSRSPVRNGANSSLRTRSPPKGPRSDRERPAPQGKEKEPDVVPSKPGKTEADVMQLDPKSKPSSSKAESRDTAEEEDEEELLIRKMMGFSTFKSTQNTKVPGNNVYGVRKEKKTEYRQYMNRVGGFNRPLSPSR